MDLAIVLWHCLVENCPASDQEMQGAQGWNAMGSLILQASSMFPLWS
jgi:hypothetical protein